MLASTGTFSTEARLRGAVAHEIALNPYHIQNKNNPMTIAENEYWRITYSFHLGR